MNDTFLLNYSVFTLFYYFIIYSFMGWCIETIYATINKKEFVNRGFLHGPFCPVYGFGTLSIIILLKPIEPDYLFLFLGSVLLTSTIEYITGYILETAFNCTWWDYRNEPFNLKGRICLHFSVLWGFVSIVALKIVHPYVIYIVNLLPMKSFIVIFYIMLLYFFIDFIITVVTIFKLKSLLSQLNIAFSELTYKLSEFKLIHENTHDMPEIKVKLEQLIESAEIKMSKKKSDIDHTIIELKIKYNSLIVKRYPNYLRLIKAFPNLKFKDLDAILKNVKNKVNKDKKIYFL